MALDSAFVFAVFTMNNSFLPLVPTKVTLCLLLVFTVGIDIVELIWCFCKQASNKEKFSEKP